ncbi:MAG: hypothetical protein ACE14P_13865 [Methanotrichaceae archaeon]
MYKKLIAIVGILLILCSAIAWAQQKTIAKTKSETTMSATAAMMYQSASPDQSDFSDESARSDQRALPDLIFVSVKVSSAPFSIDQDSRHPLLILPLQIVIKNDGSVDATKQIHLYLGATGYWDKRYWADYGCYSEDHLGGSGIVVEDGDIIINGLSAGSQKTIDCFSMLGECSPSYRYQKTNDIRIVAFLDHQSGHSQGYIVESNESNNDIVIHYPWPSLAGEGRMSAPSKVPS